jgi:hypothetical protein
VETFSLEEGESIRSLAVYTDTMVCARRVVAGLDDGHVVVFGVEEVRTPLRAGAYG